MKLTERTPEEIPVLVVFVAILVVYWLLSRYLGAASATAIMLVAVAAYIIAQYRRVG